VKEQASEKVDEAKDKASELAADAKEKGEGKYLRF
jgi:vacuolar-type H+-ATPase subunit H